MGSPEPRLAEGAADLRAVHDLARLAFGMHGSPTLDLALRLGSSRRAQATPWLLEDEGTPVSSLLAYPLVFRTPTGEVLPGYGLGAVVTHPHHRRRGHAARLCSHVAAVENERGPSIGLLFSAIGESYYEALGYRATPAWAHAATDLDGLSKSGDAVDWRPLEPRRAWRDLARVRDRARRDTLHLVRFENGWRRTVDLEGGVLWLGHFDGAHLVGYARLRLEGSALELDELALVAPEDTAPALRGLARLGLEAGVETLGSWLPPTPELAPWLEDRGRAKTLPMVRGSDPSLPLSISRADYF